MFKKTLNLFAIISIIALMASCENNEAPTVESYKPNPKPALVIAVENNDGLLTGDYASVFQMYKSIVLPVLSDVFQVPIDSMKDMSLNDIIETFGEEWQLNEIAKAGNGYYQKIVKLSDESASKSNFEQTLKSLSDDGYDIDMVWCLHGNSSAFSLNDGLVEITDLTAFLKQNDIKIRALYQTCCYASKTFLWWNNYGIEAINGAEGLNSITMFSPAYFIKEWTSGKPFDQAVQSAYNMEIEKLKSYNSQLPVMSYVLTPSTLADSKQYISGKRAGLLWNKFPEVLF